MKRFAAVLILSLTALITPVAAQNATTPQRRSVKSDVVPLPPRSPRIASALRTVAAKDTEAIVNRLVAFHNRHTLSVKVPVESGRGIAAAREWIRSEFESYSKLCNGCLEVNTYSFTEGPVSRIPQPTEIVDVYATLKGSDPAQSGRIILIGGHYDTIAHPEVTNSETEGPGANDDASGTSVALLAARTFAQLAASGVRFPATLVFVAFAAEEQGLNGSRGFAKLAKEKGWNIEAVLNNDIVGGDKSPGQDPKTVRVFSEGIPSSALDSREATAEIRLVGLENDSPSRQLARYINSVGKAYSADANISPLMVYRQDRYLRGGDHTSFNQQGYAAIRFTEFRENYNHQHQIVRTENGIEYGDLPKFVDFDYVARVARLNIATAASLAAAPAPPSQFRIDTRKLENDTTLTWQPVIGASSYELLSRDTSSPVWERSQNAGSNTTITVPESKDNVIFGLRSVGPNGERSLIVVPTRETVRK